LKPYTRPEIKRSKDDQWYVAFNYVVPERLRPFYTRGTKRFKRYGDINMYQGDERERNAKELCADWLYALQHGEYNPFREELETLDYIEMMERQVATKEEEQLIKSIPVKRLEEDLRKEISIYSAFEKFIESRGDRTENGNTISTYRATVKWLSAYFEQAGRLMEPVGSIRHIEIQEAVLQTKRLRQWVNTTYNGEVNNAMTIFNWLAKQYYMTENPSEGRIDKLSTKKTGNKWYDRDTAVIVKRALVDNALPVYRACQFTYHLCIRSKSELMKLKVSDIDQVLKRIHFSADLSKNEEECYRDYTTEFQLVLDQMNLKQYPGHYYVFGKNGLPHEKKCHKDFLASTYKPIREDLGLSDKHTIYAWKHTRVIHEMMKGTDPYKIMHLCRHSDLKTTTDYMRDFDMTLAYVYSKEDLHF
jgi:site-specific recombinase XerD